MSITAIPMPDKWMKGHAKFVSPDGKTICLEYWPKSGGALNEWTTFIWTEKDGLKPIDTLPSTISTPEKLRERLMFRNAKTQKWQERHLSELDALRKKQDSPQVNVMDMTPDGSIVIGYFLTKERHLGPSFFWREDTGIVFLDTMVRTANIAVPADFGQQDSLLDLKRISADGTTILCGEAPVWRLYNPKGFGKGGPALGIEWSELRLDGTVRSMAKDRIILSITRVTEPEGKRTLLPVPREKLILLPKGSSPLSRIKVGAKIVVTGLDGGKGKPLTARLVN